MEINALRLINLLQICLLIIDNVLTYVLELLWKNFQSLDEPGWFLVWFKPDVCGSFMDRFEVQIVRCNALHSNYNFW